MNRREVETSNRISKTIKGGEHRYAIEFDTFVAVVIMTIDDDHVCMTCYRDTTMSERVVLTQQGAAKIYSAIAAYERANTKAICAMLKARRQGRRTA